MLQKKSPESSLEQRVAELNRRIDKLTSLRFRFLSALVQGFGVALGGTLVVWLVLSLLLSIIQQVNYIPLINGFFDSAYAKLFIERLSELQGDF